ncbi:tRNA glutamyl-Q(34) synthetase GluQRS [Synechococcus sp. WH 5701]|uniref:tRNA glutamyl-Q(34) synthetase GluQRS n=1 Tax=Synechococcus sp. CCFWC 502 TaxID=2978474 RepID=UPI0009045946
MEAADRRRLQGPTGRFAPSPSGPLHLGNLRTALLAWLQARLSGGRFLLRHDDLDLPRQRPGAIEAIEADLSWLGITWDGQPLRQSERTGFYASVLSAFRRGGALYPCRCSRRMLADLSAPHGGWPLYPGTCRDQAVGWGPRQGRLPSWRLRLEPGLLRWREEIGPEGCLEAATQVGDVVLRRADGFLAYHLTSAVDDLLLAVTTVVRGADLWRSTAPQVAVSERLGRPFATSWHVPLWLDERGQRLAKRQAALGLEPLRQEGLDAAAVIGRMAASLELVPTGSRLSAAELLQEMDLASLQVQLRRGAEGLGTLKEGFGIKCPTLRSD